MKFVKPIAVIALLLIPLLPLLSPRPIPKGSKAFSLKAVYADLPYHAEWDARPLSSQEAKEVGEALSQDFHFLGSGGQCYTFASRDEKYVIKFFKQKAFAIPFWINNYPIPFLIDWMRERKSIKKEQQRDKVFTAFKLSFDNLLQETGILYVHLNRTDHLHKTLLLSDADGVEHRLNLNELEFVLQKKAVVANAAIDSMMAKGDVEGAKRAIEGMLQLNISLCKKGFRNRDPNLRSNCGFIGSSPILIDVGRIVPNDEIKEPNNYKRELQRIAPGFRRYLASDQPELLSHFDVSVAKILESEP